MFSQKNAERATKKIPTQKLVCENVLLYYPTFFKEYLDWNDFKASSIKQISES